MSLAPMKALFVEDDARVAHMLLRRYAAHVSAEVVTTDRDARTRLDTAYPLVVFDMKLPDGNGLDLALKWRKHWPSAELVVFTGYATRAARRGAGRHGIHFAEKPDGIAIVDRLVDLCVVKEPHRMAIAHLDRLCDAHDVTKRERQVVVLHMAHLSRESASHSMRISPETHRTHVSNLLRKLGFDTLDALTRYLYSADE